jgi:hypothetical protein
MAIKRVLLFGLVLLGAAATFPAVAIAEEEEEAADERCQVKLCADGLTGDKTCRASNESGGNCRDRCVDKGCDGGSQVGDAFSCIPRSSTKPFMICQCTYCGDDDGGDDGGGGDGGGGGGGGGDDWLCNDWACNDNCWWAGYEEGWCYLNECWCHSDND